MIDTTRTEDTFETLRKFVRLYGAICAITLGTVVVVAVAGGAVSPFMWIRSVILLAIAPIIGRMTVRATAGSRSSFDRVRTVTLILPIAITVVDLIPGVCPVWYAGMQILAALALTGATVLARRSPLRERFSVAA